MQPIFYPYLLYINILYVIITENILRSCYNVSK